MRKLQTISVQDKRRESNWVDALRPSPSQTLSSPDLTTGSGSGSFGEDGYPCSSDVPTVRNPCAESSFVFAGVEGTGAWGGEWKTLTISPVDNNSTEILNQDHDLYDADSVSDGNLENVYAYEIWNESPLGSHIATSLNSTIWTGAATWNNTLHQSLSGEDGYLPFGLRFDMTPIDIADPLPVGSGLRDAIVFVAMGQESDENAADGLGNTDTSLSFGLHLTQNLPGSPESAFEVSRNGDTSTLEMEFVAGTRYSVQVCVEELYTSAKIWVASEEEPEGWQISSGPSPLVDYVPGLGVRLLPLDWDAGDEANANGSKVRFHFIRLNPSSNPCRSGGSANPIIPCDDGDGESGSGYYMDTLIRKSGTYWVPASNNVSYYKQVYFDGIAVFEGQEYWLDGLKVHPMDPAIFNDTLATAEVVVL